MLHRIIPLHVYTDSWILPDFLVHIQKMTEKRLLIDLHMIRQSYERQEGTELFWIPTAENHLETFKKAVSTPALQT